MKTIAAAMLLILPLLLSGCGGGFEWLPDNNQAVITPASLPSGAEETAYTSTTITATNCRGVTGSQAYTFAF